MISTRYSVPLKKKQANPDYTSEMRPCHSRVDKKDLDEVWSQLATKSFPNFKIFSHDAVINFETGDTKANVFLDEVRNPGEVEKPT